MTKHTPGPWRTDPAFDNQIVIGPDGFMVADCAIVVFDENSPTAETLSANARLIAAAPDLLAACRVALGHFTDGDGDWCDFNSAELLRAALAKAEDTK